MKTKSYRLLLVLIFGVMLGLAYPPVPTGVTALFAFIPLFLLFESIDGYGEGLRYSYLSFFIFNLITLYWAGGFAFCKDVYQMIAGILLLLAHPLFFSVPIIGWIFIRRQFGFKISVFAFPFIWIAFEYLHSLTELSFPWLILGNTQTYDLAIIQFASFTGVYGISFWILCLNVIAFVLFTKIFLKEWKPISLKSVMMVFIILMIYFLPKYFGSQLLNDALEPSNNIVRVAIIQPNIDPFEKWETNPIEPLNQLKMQTNGIDNQKIDLVLWPETAIPFYILHPANIYEVGDLRRQIDSLECSLLTGIPDIHYYSKREVIPKSSKVSQLGEYYDTYNSSILIQPGKSEIQKYAKILLVPFAERVPYSEALNFLNAMQWNFGLGGWAHGKDTTVFNFETKDRTFVKFSNMICYESVFPWLARSFVKNGAQFLTVITNDSWWGNTSGTYQHKQIAILRAVENRRWVVQCANGGISCVIDPMGRTIQESNMYEQATLFAQVIPNYEQSYYTSHGDWLAEFALMISMFILMAALGKMFYQKIRKRNTNEIY